MIPAPQAARLNEKEFSPAARNAACLLISTQPASLLEQSRLLATICRTGQMAQNGGARKSPTFAKRWVCGHCSFPPNWCFSAAWGPQLLGQNPTILSRAFCLAPSILAPNSSLLGQNLLNYGFELQGVLKTAFSECAPGRSLTVAARR
ncbi:MAG: hypothetical protein MI725_12225 [Pirellulales bacterium]|nr:hypothetical protein [Pirellulales bacterium]